MTEKKQGAAEWLRGIADKYQSEDGFGCREIVEMLGFCCDEIEMCNKCRVKAMRVIADRIDAERALPEGVEWPRFEDGELVKVGDEVEFEGETWKVTGVGFESPGFDIGLRCGLNIGAMSGSYGERVKRPTPKVLDADGAPIEVGDTVWCGEDQLSVVCSTDGAAGDVRTTVKDDEGVHYTLKPSCLSHKRPDSWKRLLEDLDKGAVAAECSAESYCCDYFGADDCEACPASEVPFLCGKASFKDVADRIRALRGEAE